MFNTNLGRHKSSSPASTRTQPSGTFWPAGCRGREGRARVDCEHLLGSRRYGSVERFQALLQAFAEAFALPLTADVIDYREGPDNGYRYISKDAEPYRDAAGNAFGEQILRAGSTEGQVNEVSYSFPRPGSTAPAPKVSYVTKVGDQVCAVGYYR